MRQEVTRAHKGWALDSVTLHNDVLKATKEDITAPPAVCIWGKMLLIFLTNLASQSLSSFYFYNYQLSYPHHRNVWGGGLLY